MSPFIMKKTPKTKGGISHLNALFSSLAKKKYNKHSDDPVRPDPESDDGDDHSTTSSSSSSEVESKLSRRGGLSNASMPCNLIILDEKHYGKRNKHRDMVVAAAEASKASGSSSGTGTSSVTKLIAQKLASAIADSVISAVASADSKKTVSRKHRRNEEEENELSSDDDDHDDSSNESADSNDESDISETDDDDDDHDEEEETDDDESDDDDEESYDSDDDSDDESYDSDDSSSSSDDEKKQKQSKKKQAQIESQCAKYREQLSEIRNAIQKMSEISSSSESMNSNKFMKKQIDGMKRQQKEIETKLRADEKKRDKMNVTEFKTLLRKKNSTNDLRYFRRHMSQEEQTKVIQDLKKIHAVSIIEKPYRLTLLETDIPIAFKAIAMRKINSLRSMEPGCGEYYKVKNWVDTFMKIPFNRRKNLPLTIEDGLQKCSEFMEASKVTLDHAVYGLNDAKLQIMQMVGQWISNPGAMGSAIAIQGPMGTGKTSLVKEGISKILGRDFAFIALGGATDSSFLEGHSYTYEGSTWGKIVEIIIQCGSMNPVIYFDELDKISETAKGEEIVGILTHLTDTSQNSQFHDRYFAEIDFDLSKCLFIFSYNDESKVNPILLDRMYRINTTGYNKKDKTQIAQKYLIPKICTQVGFREGDIVIPDTVIEHIVENYTEGEQGVRNLKRCLEVVHRKLNLYRLIKPDTQLFEKELSLKVTFPFSVSNEVIDKLIKPSGDGKRPNLSLYL
jgi:ATP-dependent Lon protease